MASANSIAIGNSATTGTYSNSTSIGNGAISTADNTIQLGNTTVSNVKTSGTLTAGTVTYPNTHAGTSGQVLTSLGSGTLTWTTPASGSSSTYTIGLNSSLGGYVVYITPSGKHGIVSEIINQVTGGTIESMYKNINDPNLHSAAGKEFTDWRIPTIWEMNQIFPYKSAIGGFDLNYYYFTSSNFTTSNSGLVIDMGNGGVGSGFTQPLNLRAIRSF